MGSRHFFFLSSIFQKYKNTQLYKNKGQKKKIQKIRNKKIREKQKIKMILEAFMFTLQGLLENVFSCFTGMKEQGQRKRTIM